MSHTPHGPRVADERDHAIVAERMRLFDQLSGPQVGDWVDFADGTRQRISYVWGDGSDDKFDGVQTSAGGSWHLTEFGGMSFSGGLDPLVPWRTLTPTDETRPGFIWIFHHNLWTAHNGVDVEVTLRVWRSTQSGPCG